ncbi:hypothetical protein [Paenibacillus gallinarum]|uniref:Uncharacterized protein n=1 Tax=Paenibacillus gallinarum TaxID=2762232 RepID=A0ABR8ST29_9BACL|nr:hypothetical protein [Paenibacillus gallinarum]MBD7966646.1 hypothetical protein [Paenibacillus gallinarum]
MKTKNKVVTNFLTNRAGIVEIFIIAFAIALSVSLTANYLFLIEGLNKIFLLVLGLTLFFSSMIYLIFIKFKTMRFEKKISGFFIYNKVENELIPVYGYNYGENIARIIKSTITEKPAYYHAWNTSKLSDSSPIIIGEKTSDASNAAQKLIIESTQFFLIDALSTHLSKYFNEYDKDKFIKEYGRNDILQVLSKNRIMELFTTPIENRESFVNNEYNKKNYIDIIKVSDDGSKELVRRTLPSGEQFVKFDLILPVKSSIQAIDSNTIMIKTAKLSMVIKVKFSGMNTYIPPLFVSQYLKQKSNDVKAYQVDVNINVKINYKGFFSLKGWEYFEWVDSFLDYIEEKMSRKTFFESIDWSSLQAQIIVFRTNLRRKSKDTLKTDKEGIISDDKEL